MRQPDVRQVAIVRAAVFVASSVPSANLVWGAFAGTLGANPIEAITRSTGWWTLFFLCASLAVTPVRRITGANWLIKLRRMLGLFAFFHAVAHLAAFVWFDHAFDVMSIARDVARRPFVAAGFLAFLLLVPLAATSTAGMQRRLGRRWQTLHYLVYLIAPLAVLHFWWLVKADFARPAQFALAVAVLLGFRIVWRIRRAA